jgi:hypothetical protein
MSTLQRISIMAVTVLLFGTVEVSAGELPQYEVAGFPISPLQISVLGASGIREQMPTPRLTLNGMPASPSQIAVIELQLRSPKSAEQTRPSGTSTQTTN